MKNEFVTKIETVNTGGGCMVDIVHLWDGRVITLNDECLCVFKSESAFWDDQGESAEISHYFGKRR